MNIDNVFENGGVVKIRKNIALFDQEMAYDESYHRETYSRVRNTDFSKAKAWLIVTVGDYYPIPINSSEDLQKAIESLIN